MPDSTQGCLFLGLLSRVGAAVPRPFPADGDFESRELVRTGVYEEPGKTTLFRFGSRVDNLLRSRRPLA